MRNNRKQKIYSMLDSLTQTEFESYIKDRKMNNKLKDLLELAKRYKPTSHRDKLINQIGEKCNINDYWNQIYLLGEANIIAIILYYGLQKDFNIKDFVRIFTDEFLNCKDMKNYVYDIMKDFK